MQKRNRNKILTLAALAIFFVLTAAYTIVRLSRAALAAPVPVAKAPAALNYYLENRGLDGKLLYIMQDDSIERATDAHGAPIPGKEIAKNPQFTYYLPNGQSVLITSDTCILDASIHHVTPSISAAQFSGHVTLSFDVDTSKHTPASKASRLQIFTDGDVYLNPLAGTLNTLAPYRFISPASPILGQGIHIICDPHTQAVISIKADQGNLEPLLKILQTPIPPK